MSTKSDASECNEELATVDNLVRTLTRDLEEMLARHRCQSRTSDSTPELQPDFSLPRVQETTETFRHFCELCQHLDSLLSLIVRSKRVRIEATSSESPEDILVEDDLSAVSQPVGPTGLNGRNGIGPDPRQFGWPPALPPINDEALRTQVFIHRSYVRHEAEERKAGQHNERLEFLGDAALNWVTAELLYHRFPEANEGDLTIYRAELVCNDTLSRFAIKYRLHRKLHMHATMSETLSASSSAKVCADLFEAYTGALVIEHRFSEMRQWLEQLYAPMIRDMANHSTVDKNAKSRLYSLIGSRTQCPVYRVVEVKPLYTVYCVIRDDVIGTGTDRSITDAGLRAAMDALGKPEVLQKYALTRD